MSYDFFLAHAGPDSREAERLYDLLVAEARVFLDSRSIVLGDDWDRTIAQAQKNSRLTVVLVSARTEDAFYQREEIAAAIDLARRDEAAHRVVPVYLEPGLANVPYGLRLKHGLTMLDQYPIESVAARLLDQHRGLAAGAEHVAMSPSPGHPAVLPGRAGDQLLISFNSADVAWATWLHALLRAAGSDAKLQDWRFMSDRELALRRREATAGGGRILVVMSEAFCRSPVCRQWLALLTGSRATARKVALVQVEPCSDPLESHRPTAAVEGMEAAAATSAVLSVVRRLGVAVSAGQAMTADLPRFPGNGPDISGRIPEPRADFAGRTRELGLISDALLNRRADSTIQAFAICGLGGVGKTALAAQYAHRLRSRYAITWWVRAEDASTISADLSALALEMDIPKSPAQEKIIRALWRELRRRGPWLIVFDNVDSYASVRHFWPVEGSGHVLLTSRRKDDWQALGDSSVELGVLSMDEAVLVVQKRAPDVDEKAASLLARRLDRLPLALAQASSYIFKAKISVEDYLDRLERYTDEVLTRFPPDDYSETVQTTWSVSISRAEGEAGGCRHLLNMCGYLAPDRIPRSLFSDHTDILPTRLRALVSKPVSYEGALAELSGYSMITLDAENLSVHRMVQHIIRAQMPTKQQQSWTRTAVRLLDAAFPANPRPAASWPGCAQLVSHVEAAARHAEGLGVEGETAGRMLHRAGDYLTERAEYGQALSLLRSAQRIRERRGDVAGLADTLARMSFAHYCRAELGEAERIIKQAARLREEAFGPDHPLFASDLTHYGRVVQERGRVDDAILLMERAVRILEASYSPDDPRICETLNYLGVAQWRRGQLQAARSTLERTMRIRSQEFGADHPETAYSRRMLALIARDQGDLSTAWTEATQAIKVFEETYGVDYVEALTGKHILGDVLLRQGNAAAALVIYQAVLNAHIDLLGADHPSAAGSRRRIGAALREEGRLAEALKELERARKVFENGYGGDHPYVAEVLAELGPVLLGLGQDSEAEAVLGRARTIVERAYGPDHPALIAILEYQSRLPGSDEDDLLGRADQIRRVVRGEAT